MKIQRLAPVLAVGLTFLLANCSSNKSSRPAEAASDAAAAPQSDLYYKFPFTTTDVFTVKVEAYDRAQTYTLAVQGMGTGSPVLATSLVAFNGKNAVDYVLNLKTGKLTVESPNQPTKYLDAPTSAIAVTDDYYKGIQGLIDQTVQIVNGGSGNAQPTPRPELKFIVDYLAAIEGSLTAGK